MASQKSLAALLVALTLVAFVFLSPRTSKDAAVLTEQPETTHLQLFPLYEGIINETHLVRSRVIPGDNCRYRAFLAKLNRGEPVTVLNIGGSISQGRSKLIPTPYAKLFENALNAAWPSLRGNHTVINKASSGCGTNCPLLGFDRFFAGLSPDAIIVEYVMNDVTSAGTNMGRMFSQAAREGYLSRDMYKHRVEVMTETLIHKIYRRFPDIAVMYLSSSFRCSSMASAEKYHAHAMEHLNLPLFSLRAAIGEEYRACDPTGEETCFWRRDNLFIDVERKCFHPNGLGHEILSSILLFNLFKDAQSVSTAGDEVCLSGEQALPPYKWGNRAYQNRFRTAIASYELNEKDVENVTTKNWERVCWEGREDKCYLETRHPHNYIELAVPEAAGNVTFTLGYLASYENVGKVAVEAYSQGDSPILTAEIDAHIEEKISEKSYQLIDLPQGAQRLRIRYIEEKEKKFDIFFASFA